MKGLGLTLLVPGVLLILMPGSLRASAGEKLGREALFSAVLENNTELLILAEGEKISEHKFSGARASRYPQVNFSADISYIANPDSYTISTGELYNGELYPGMTLLLPDEDYTVELAQSTRYSFGLTINQPLYTWGKINDSIEAAELGIRGARLEREIKRHDLQTALDLILLNLKSLETLREESNGLIETAEALHRLSEEGHRNGFLLYSDLLGVEIRVREAELSRAEIDQQIDLLLLRLETLTGLEELSLARLDFTSPSPIVSDQGKYTLEKREDLTAAALGQNRSLDLLKLAAEGAEISTRITRVAGPLRPDVGLYFDFGYTLSKLPLIQEDWDEFDTPQFIASLGVRSLLYDGGESTANTRAAEAEMNESLLKLENGRAAVKEEVAAALFRIDLHNRKIEYYRLQVEMDREKEAQKREAWMSGYGEEREVLQEALARRTHRMELIKEEALLGEEFLKLRNILGESHS